MNPIPRKQLVKTLGRQLLFCVGAVAVIFAGPAAGRHVPATSGQYASTPNFRVHLPHFGDADPQQKEAIFWFGQVDDQHNYADVRLAAYDEVLVVYLHIIDHWLWYDESPTPEELRLWDAASLYLHLEETGSAPTGLSHRFTAGFSPGEEREAHQAAQLGDGAAWVNATTPFTSTTGWRGSGFNGATARGWTARFKISYESLGLSGLPADGTVWRLALEVHDRDGQEATPNPVQVWPPKMDSLQPNTWGELIFGMPVYSPQPSTPEAIIEIKHGLNGVNVVDAHVGGHSTCGEDYNPNFFDGWGDANYAHYEQINIQNQWDIADWPCFSKYYITFPLDTVPIGKTIISATLSLNHFGNADPGGATPSYIQVSTLAEHWDEATITWNNAPLAVENLTGAWIPVLAAYPGWPGIPRTWDVSLPVANAYSQGEPLRLALYSADSDYHSGKYFYSSDADVDARPILRIHLGSRLGNPSPEPTTTPAPATPTLVVTTPPPAGDERSFLPTVRQN